MEQIIVDLTPNGIKSACHASQYDIGRHIRFALRNRRQVYTLTGTETVTAIMRKPDGTERTENLANTSSNYVDLVTSKDTCNLSGDYECELKVVNGDVEIGSGNFIMKVEPDAFDGVIEEKTASGEIASFETQLPFPLNEAKFTLPYKAGGYTELTHYLASSTPVLDEAPYLYRKSPSGNNCLNKLVGFSVAFNQLLKSLTSDNWGSESGVTATYSDGIVTIDSTIARNGIYQNIDIINGHRYLHLCKVKSGNAPVTFDYGAGGGSFSEGYLQFNLPANSEWTECNGIITASDTVNRRIYVFSAYEYSGLKVKDIQIIDLTAFFGSSTIADYLYNLESQTAGAGVQKFKELGFDAPYYPFNAASLMSSIPVARRVIGFNRWDEKWKIKLSAGVEYLASKNPIPVFPNTTYYIKTPTSTSIDVIDENDTYISFIGNRTNATFVTPSNCHFIRIATPTANYGNVYNNDICVNISDESKNGTYEPYKETFYNFGGDTLRGLLKLDENNNIYADGDTYKASGEVGERYGIVDLGSLTWNTASTNTANIYRMKATLPHKAFADNVTFGAICSKYIATSADNTYLKVKGISGNSTGTAIFIYDENYNQSGDETDFKNSLDGAYLVYPLATPTTATADPFTNPQEAGTTEEIIDGNVYGKVELGSLNWNTSWYSSEAPLGRIYVQLSDKKIGRDNMICSAYPLALASDNYMGDLTITGNSGSKFIYIRDTRFDSGDDLVASLSGKYLYYEKSDSAGVEIPLGHESVYADNLSAHTDTFTQIYGGDYDAASGILTSRYNPDGTTKATPDVIQLTPEAIIAMQGTNKVWHDDGNTEVKYVDYKEET